MKLQDIQMTVETVNGGEPRVILGGKAPYFEYQDGKRIGNEPVGIRYTVILIGNHLATMDVKVPGKDTTPNLTDEIIATRNASMDFITLEFIGSAVKIYNIKGEQIIAASASAVKLAGDEDIDFGRERI